MAGSFQAKIYEYFTNQKWRSFCFLTSHNFSMKKILLVHAKKQHMSTDGYNCANKALDKFMETVK